MLCNTVLVSVAQQSESAICIHVSPYPLPLEPPSILPIPPSKSSQSTKPISLCYAAASHQPTILHSVVKPLTSTSKATILGWMLTFLFHAWTDISWFPIYPAHNAQTDILETLAFTFYFPVQESVVVAYAPKHLLLNVSGCLPQST